MSAQNKMLTRLYWILLATVRPDRTNRRFGAHRFTWRLSSDWPTIEWKRTASDPQQAGLVFGM